MDARTAYERRDEHVLLDVREPQEWMAGRAVGAVHIPMSQLGARQHELPEGQTLVCVCKVGSRSAAVVGALRRAGYEAENLEGGMLAWRSAGLPMDADGDAPPTVV